MKSEEYLKGKETIVYVGLGEHEMRSGLVSLEHAKIACKIAQYEQAINQEPEHHLEIIKSYQIEIEALMKS